MANMAFKMTALALIGLGVGVGGVRADQAQVEERLRQEVTIKLEDVTIANALEQIGQKAGVKIVLSPEAAWKLPAGQDTRVSVTLEGRLAESLEKMLNSFFMRYAAGGESLTIYPRSELKHIIGRPSASELKLLANVYGSRLWISGSSPGAQDILNLLAGEPIAIVPYTSLGWIDEAMRATLKRDPQVSTPADPNSRRGTPVTIALLLDAARAYGPPSQLWYVEGPQFPREVPEIRIVSQEEFWQAHLDQIIDVSFSNETGESIIRRLAAWADLALRFPGGYVPESLAREMTLEVQNVKLVDVLDRALSVLGVHRTLYLSEGVMELHPLSTEPMKGTPQQTLSEPQPGGGYVGKISIPMEGGRYFIEFMLRESDLPEELRKLRQQVMTEVIAELSREGKMKEVFKQLSSQPAQKK